MAENQQNPLAKHFRQPAIYIKLPSNGEGYPQGAIDMPPNGELPVFPMTALDEIISRTPDALFNGSATVKLIQSCVPNIVDPWSVSNVDLDLILTAIRIATFGHEMEMTVRCPGCEEEDNYAIDLRNIIDNIKKPDYSKPVNVSGLEIYFRPLTYKELNASAQKQFEQQKILQLSTDEASTAPTEEKLRLMGQALENLTTLTIDAMVGSISAVSTDGELVSDKQHIREFLTNTDKKVYDQIRDHLTAIREEADIKPLHFTCNSCKHEFDSPFTLDQSNFFA